MNERVYLDWNATAPLRAEARAAVIEALDQLGNPSSVHAEGRLARGIVERARSEIAEALGARPQEVIFTSGATEAASVLAHFPAVEVDPTTHDALWSHHRPGPGAVQAVGLANSETGIITPAQKGEGWLLLDATQAIGRIPFAFSWSGADLVVISGHKFGAPKGVGALLVRGGLDIPPLSLGGGQELSRRAGTENIAGIAGMAAALKAAMRDLEAGVWDEVRVRRDALEARLAAAAPDLIIVGQERERLPNTTCMISPGWKGETQVMQMDLAGFAVSAGSACSSGKVKPSRVLKAMGYDDDAAKCALRVSLTPAVTDAQLERFADTWLATAKRHYARAA